MRRLTIGTLGTFGLCVVLVAAGPRVEIDREIRFDESIIGADPSAYLAASESRFDDIRTDLEKEIIWADSSSKAKTDLAIVYLHGFSASKGEVRPLADLVAGHFGANLFYTRLAGHGRSQGAMGEATVNAWINDLAEALAIGRMIGDRVIVIATSTGGSLAAWGAAEPGLMEDVAGLVLLSPNFGIRAAGTWLLLLPWGETLARWVVGPERGSEPESEAIRHLWTWRYPVRALLPLTAMMTLARERDYADVDVPALFILSDQDRVVLPQETRQVAAQWGAPSQILAVEDSDDPDSHVIAGDAQSPSTTRRIATEIIRWVTELR